MIKRIAILGVMLKTTLTISFVLVMQGIFAQDLQIRGKVNTRDSLIVFILDGKGKPDTVYTPSGAFHFARKPPGILISVIGLDLKNQLRFRCDFFAEKGTVYIDTAYVAHLSHPELQARYENFKARFNPFKKFQDGLNATFQASNRTREDTVFYRKLMQYTRQVEKGIVTRFISENRDNIVGAYVFADYFSQGGSENLALADSIYKTFDQQLYTRSFALQLMKIKLDALHALVPGSPVTPFSGTTITGASFSLAALRGKYVVLDFWGTWCPGCVREFPALKNYYAKYRDKLEIVSIDCHDTETEWRAGVKKYDLPWIQLLNHEQSSRWELLYNVVSFPTLLLIDPRGNLVQAYNGDPDKIYATLDELMKTVI